METERLALMLQLRKSFEREVVAAMGIQPCNEMLNAWLFVQLARSHSAGLVTDEYLFVPLEPLSERIDATSPLAKYVTRMIDREQAAAALKAATKLADEEPPQKTTASTLQGLDVAAVATRLDGWLRRQWTETRRLLATRAMLGEGAGSAAPVVCSSAKDDGSAYTVRLDPPPRGQQSSHTINGRTLAKLRRGYVGEAASFDMLLWRLLHRYSAFFGPHAGEGAGWQLATPPAAMEALTSDLGVDTECFASPLNRHQPRFYSAFPDTDAPFGSRGNFFSAELRLSSAEAGPPYDLELMEMMMTRLTALLDAQTEPLSVVLVVPDWRTPPAPFWRAIMESRHLVRAHSLPKERHKYVSGRQHTLPAARKNSGYELGETATLLAWLQNEAGRAKWPVTVDVVRRQAEAWDVSECTL